MSDIEKMPLTSMDVAAERIEKLKTIFPEAFVEGRVDHDALLRSLGQWVEPGKERFGLNWPGKADCMKVIQTPSVGTLLPMRDESVNFDTTENLIIEGDNLEVLKLLQKSYFGKVKMIYIDPPYNTGGEFIYPDNYHEGLREYLRYSRQVDEEGYKLSTNTEADGRFHSRWLSMMFPRLFLARNLLREDGVIFISIDDNEVNNLRALMNEIFGEENFLANIVWHNSSRQSPLVAIEHEYILAYGKNPSANGAKWNRSREIAEELFTLVEDLKATGKTVEESQKILSFEIDCLLEEDAHKGTKEYAWLGNYKNIDENWNIYYAVDLSGEGAGPPRKFGDKIIPAPPGRHWMGQEYIDELLADGRIVWRGDRAYRKLYIRESLDNLKSVIRIPTRNGSELLKQLLGKDCFDKPKPHNLIRHLAHYVLNEDDVILDFFAGSGTTAHAILDLNKHDDGNRKFVLIQLPEKTDNPEYPTIAHITRERVRRVIKKLNEADEGKLDLENTSKQDRGFKSLKLSFSNFKVWEGDVENVQNVAETLSLFAENTIPGRTSEDILYELLLKAGFPITAPVEKLSMAGKHVYSIAEGALLICLDKELTIEVIEAMVEREPSQILCLDEGFKGNDQLKVNAVQTVKSRNRNEESDIVFRVV